MPTATSLNTRRRTPWVKRVALLGLLGLQVAVAASPLLESNHRSLVTHIEQDGTTHRFVAHDEATCAACAIRLIHAAAAPQTPLAVLIASAHFVPARRIVAAPRRSLDPTNPSRAPPTVG